MYQELYKTLSAIYNCYETVYESGKEISLLLREKKLKELQPLHVKQLSTLEQLKELKQAVEGMLDKAPVAERKISALLPLFSVEEGEQITKLQKQIRDVEAQARKVMLHNQHYLEIAIKTTENIVDFVSEMNMERAHNSQVFMNELL